jgi:hypothetical protein
MELRRIIAADARSAREEAIRLYGADALIVSSRSLPKNRTEVIVAVEESDTGSNSPMPLEMQPTSRDTNPFQRILTREANVSIGAILNQPDRPAAVQNFPDPSSSQSMPAPHTMPAQAMPAQAMPAQTIPFSGIAANAPVPAALSSAERLTQAFAAHRQDTASQPPPAGIGISAWRDEEPPVPPPMTPPAFPFMTPPSLPSAAAPTVSSAAAPLASFAPSVSPNASAGTAALASPVATSGSPPFPAGGASAPTSSAIPQSATAAPSPPSAAIPAANPALLDASSARELVEVIRQELRALRAELIQTRPALPRHQDWVQRWQEWSLPEAWMARCQETLGHLPPSAWERDVFLDLVAQWLLPRRFPVWAGRAHLFHGEPGIGRSSALLAIARAHEDRFGVGNALLISHGDPRTERWGTLLQQCAGAGIQCLRSTSLGMLSGLIDVMAHEERCVLVDVGPVGHGLFKESADAPLRRAARHLAVSPLSDPAQIALQLTSEVHWDSVLFTRLEPNAERLGMALAGPLLEHGLAFSGSTGRRIGTGEIVLDGTLERVVEQIGDALLATLLHDGPVPMTLGNPRTPAPPPAPLP